MTNALEAVVEIFTWVGFGVGAMLAGVTLIAYLMDGTWIAVRAVVERLDGRTVLRWFDEAGGVNEAVLHPTQEHEIGGRDMADVWMRQGAPNRMRLHRRSLVVRTLTTLTAVFLGVGVIALIASWVLLFVRG